MGWNHVSIPELQPFHRWSLRMDKKFHPTLYWACDYLTMLGLRSIHVSKKYPWHLIALAKIQQRNRAHHLWSYDIMSEITSIVYLHFFCILTYAIIYVLIHHIIFWLYLYFLNSLYFFKYSCTNIFHRHSLFNFYSRIVDFIFCSYNAKVSQLYMAKKW